MEELVKSFERNFSHVVERVNPLEIGDSLLFGWRFEPTEEITEELTMKLPFHSKLSRN